MNIGERIRSCREEYGMSQAQLARALWVSRNTISNWECGATTPDIESFVLMSALFGISIDTMVNEDADVMARALERDRNHLLMVGGAAVQVGRNPEDGMPAWRVDMPSPADNPILDTYPAIGITEPGGTADSIRLVRRWTWFNAAGYCMEEGGRSIGGIRRGRALFYPYYDIRMDGFGRVQLKRDLKVDEGIATVYRLEGESLAFDGNVLGPEFGVTREGRPLVRVCALPAGPRLAFSLEVVDDATRPLALGVACAILLMRDYDRNLVRDE